VADSYDVVIIGAGHNGLVCGGSGTHPGGGVTGAPGHNAARAILTDSGRRWFRKA
jgi:phytoene dehydrogenase-like protein